MFESNMQNNKQITMKNNTKQRATAKSKAAKRQAPAKTVKKAEAEPVDRLPGTLEELKGTKGGLVAYLLLSGKDKQEIATELKAAFKVPDTQAVKIVRRITGRARFFQRVFQLMATK